MSDNGRIHVYLYKLGEDFKQERKGYGNISFTVRQLISDYMEDRLVRIDPIIGKMLEENRDEEAIEILKEQLVALRSMRVQASYEALQGKRKAAKKKALDQAGVPPPARQRVLKKMEELEATLVEEEEQDDSRERETKEIAPGVRVRV